MAAPGMPRATAVPTRTRQARLMGPVQTPTCRSSPRLTPLHRAGLGTTRLTATGLDGSAGHTGAAAAQPPEPGSRLIGQRLVDKLAQLRPDRVRARRQ